MTVDNTNTANEATSPTANDKKGFSVTAGGDMVDNKPTEEIKPDENVKGTPATIEQDVPQGPPEVVESEPKKPEETSEINLSEIQEPDKATEVLKDKGFDYVDLQGEYAKTGEISPETRENLAKVGITDEVIDNFIDGQKAKVEKEIDNISQEIGGREAYLAVTQWASENLSDEEKISINNVRDLNVMKIILKELKQRMDNKEGVTPDLISGDGGKTVGNIFESQSEMMTAIKDPKYNTDEAYRAKIAKKVKASLDAGIDLGIN